MAKARALYDNYSETSDELSFLRDDVLEIIEKDYDGMEGWWLCGLKGKTGIAPANRLVIITIKEATSDYDLPPIKNSSFSADKRPQASHRDTTMQDYDTPVSNRSHKSPLQNSHLKKPEKVPRATLSPGEAREYDDYCIPSNKDEGSSVSGDSPKSPSPQTTGTNFEKYYTSYLKSEKDVNVFSRQVTSMMKKWYDSSDHNSRAQVVKAICISFWKAIQAYVAEAAKTIASIKGLVSAETFKSFEEVKHSSQDLENVLDYLNRFNALDAKDKTKIEFLQQLSALTSSLSTHSRQLSEFFKHVEKEGLWLRVGEATGLTLVDGRRNLTKAKGKNSESTPLVCKSTRSSYGDYDTPSTKFAQTQQDKLLNSPTSLDILVREKGKKSETSDLGRHNSSLYSDPDRSFEATDYDVPRSSDVSDYHSEGVDYSDYSRPTSSEFLDYDCPRPKNANASLKNKSVESLASELSRSSAVDDQVDYDIPTSNFSVFQLRAPDARSGNRSGMTKSEDAFSKRSIFSSFEELDYDIPSKKGEVPSIEVDSPEVCLNRMVRNERNLLRYYFPFIAEELKNLSSLIERLQNYLTSSKNKTDSKKPLTLINDVKGLAACSHKILFVVDSILKRIQSNPDLTSQLNFSCAKICEHLKNITNLVKQVSQAPSAPAEKLLPSAVSNFQLHVHSVEKMVRRWN